MSERHLVIVDLETTSLDTATCWPLEVAAIDCVTGQALEFVPWVDDISLGKADKKALQINRYYERGAWENMAEMAETREFYRALHDMLRGHTLGGSNPRFDAAVLRRFLGGEPWHHRLADLATYAAPALGRGPDNLPGLVDVCAALGVENSGAHSAMGDVQATAECFRRLRAHYNTAPKVAL